jgi:TolA-binding protein
MRALIRHLCIVFLLCATASRAVAADAEGRAFTNAVHKFQDGFFPQAELAFSNLVAQFTNSSHVSEALLFQARAALAQKRFQPASDLLATNIARAGTLGDQFKYWLGRVQLDSGKPEAAADTFAQLSNTFTNSPLLLDAAVSEAEARFGLRQFPRVVQLIEAPGAFQSAAATRGADDPLVARGYLLLARALFQQRLFDRAERAVEHIGETATGARLRWERQFLLCEIQFAAGRTEAALANTTNLMAIARLNGDARLSAASIALQGEILQALNELDAATKAYEANLAENAPPERQREAFVKTVQLALARNQVADAITRLEKYIAAHPTEAGSDVALLSIGELRLKQLQLGTNAPAATNLPPSTNLVELALENFNRLIRDFPNSAFAPHAQLGRGWALLAQRKAVEALPAFRDAAEKLPRSEAQAVARFKLADLQFSSGDVTNAAQNYRHVIHDYREFARVRRDLVDRALYQMLQASIAAKDQAAATEAIQRITTEYPKSTYAEPGLLLFAQSLIELASPAEARKSFAQFIQLFPDSPLCAEAKLAIARTYEHERNWTNAVREYSQWLTQYPTNENLPRAEYCLALATYETGNETNALTQFTNFVAQFPRNLLAARAQNWIGDYYFNLGLRSTEQADQNFREAERNYQLLFQPRTISTNWPASELTFTAQLKAGNAAFRRQSWIEAIEYFTNLIQVGQANLTCPRQVVCEAVFAYGDTTTQLKTGDALDRYSRALSIFEYIPKQVPVEAYLPRAWGRMADCYLQLASADSNAYTNAYEHYRKVTNAPAADIAARSAAEFGMAEVRRKQAALLPPAEAMQMQRQALDHYLNVAYATNAREGEQPEPIWIRDAALAAARLCEAEKNWELAISLYQRVAEMLPVVRPDMERRINLARKQQSEQPKR